MRREERKWTVSTSVQVPRWSTWAEQSVVAKKPTKAGGAKGLRCPVGGIGQPLAGGADDADQAVCHLETDGVGSVQGREGQPRRPGSRRSERGGVRAESGWNLYRLWNRLASGTYFPPPVLQVEIPKRDGWVCTLEIPTVGDRVAQTVVAMQLGPIAERQFHPGSYGYRPGRNAHQAVE